VIVSPALADANNGNWQTARRWRQLLGGQCAVRITREWPDAGAAGDDVMLALHARRSATSVAAWNLARGGRQLAVVLTGTDLYGDLAHDAQAQQSISVAHRLVVLQDLGISALPPALRAKARVIYQSSTPRQVLLKSPRSLRAVMVGHLRQVKSPQTLFEAAGLLRGDIAIRISHIGEAAEPALGKQAIQVQQACPHYRWLGAQSHEATRRAIQRAHVLVHTSAVEGGAHVIMEAVLCGTPVLASRIDGNVGMLGPDYEGYFNLSDAARLASLLAECRAGQFAPPNETPTLFERLAAQCALRAGLFMPRAEQAALEALVAELRLHNQSHDTAL